jgi:hypothetical protein
MFLGDAFIPMRIENPGAYPKNPAAAAPDPTLRDPKAQVPQQVSTAGLLVLNIFIQTAFFHQSQKFWACTAEIVSFSVRIEFEVIGYLIFDRLWDSMASHFL